MNWTKKSIWFPVTHFKANKLFDEFRLHVLKHTSTEEGESSFVPSFFGSQFGVLQILALFPLLKFKCCLFVVFFKINICKKKKNGLFFNVNCDDGQLFADFHGEVGGIYSTLWLVNCESI